MSTAPAARLATRSAPPEQSIWTDPSEAVFRQRVVELEKLTNAVPLDSEVFPSQEWKETRPATQNYHSQLSLEAEQSLADDIAYLAAVGEGAQSVSAATVQEPQQLAQCSDEKGRPSLRVTMASVDAIDPASQDILRSLFDKLSHVTPAKRDAATEDLFRLVSSHHRQRLLNRLRSVRWSKPTYLARTHKKPLHADFSNLMHRVNHAYEARRERRIRKQVEANISALASVLESFEHTVPGDPDAEDLRRRDLIRACYDFCTSPATADFLYRLQSVRTTAQIQAALKTLQQTEKIAAYYRIPLSLVDLACHHPTLFSHVDLHFLEPYEASPLEVAYQPWATSTHVHAEVSLAVHHDLDHSAAAGKRWLKPRCIGASKYLCYLCYLFVRHHGQYFPSATHGACYDQWTVPDLAEYPDAVRHRYQAILRGMFRDISAATQGAVRRPEPMTSRENLIASLPQS